MMYDLARLNSSFNHKYFPNTTSTLAMKDVYSYYRWGVYGYGMFVTVFSRSPNFGENYDYLNTVNIWMPHSFLSSNRPVGGGISLSGKSGYLYCGYSFTAESQLPVVFCINDNY